MSIYDDDAFNASVDAAVDRWRTWFTTEYTTALEMPLMVSDADAEQFVDALAARGIAASVTRKTESRFTTLRFEREQVHGR